MDVDRSMTDLFWPGDPRAAGLLDDPALLKAMVRVESAWLAELGAAGVADVAVTVELAQLVGEGDLPRLSDETEKFGNPAGPLVALLRERTAASAPQAARWLHRGLTSQDVVDTALMLCARAVDERLRAELGSQLVVLAELAERYRDTAMVARTLTQHATPYTFGAKVATWIAGVSDAAEDLLLADVALPAQIGGAAGTSAATVELSSAHAAADPVAAAVRIGDAVARRLGLLPRPPWHTARAPITRIGGAWAGLCSAYGRIANDVLLLSRPELGELSEPPGRGGSSTMPQKVNPILSVLARRAALAAPSELAKLNIAAAEAVDERPDGGWHLEWPALQALGRHTVIAAGQLTDLLSGLDVHADRMRANLETAGAGVLAEQRAIALLAGAEPRADYDGAAGMLADAASARARALATQLT